MADDNALIPKSSILDPFLGLNGAPRYQLWPERMARSMIGSTAFPGEVAQRAYAGNPMMTEEMVPGAADMGLNLLTGGRSIPGPGGASAGMFIGPKARGWDPVLADTARVAERMGVDPDQVWGRTGYGSKQFADKGMRSEISDRDARILRETSLATRLSEILDHPELYAAYPELRDIFVSNRPDIKGYAAMDSTRGRAGLMRVNFDKIAADKADVRSVLLHEIQHNIDHREGFARGGNPAEFMPAGTFEKMHEARNGAQSAWPDAVKQMQGYAQKHGFALDEEKAEPLIHGLAQHGENFSLPPEHPANAFLSEIRQDPTVKQLLTQTKEYQKHRAVYDQAYDQYHRQAGEVTARVTEKRKDLDSAERQAISPKPGQFVKKDVTYNSFYGQDVPIENQLVRLPVR